MIKVKSLVNGRTYGVDKGDSNGIFEIHFYDDRAVFEVMERGDMAEQPYNFASYRIVVPLYENGKLITQEEIGRCGAHMGEIVA